MIKLRPQLSQFQAFGLPLVMQIGLLAREGFLLRLPFPP
jgi:hypothetical protein